MANHDQTLPRYPLINSKVGRYELIEPSVLGHNEFIYKAQHEKLPGRFVAIKVLPRDKSTSGCHNNELEREAEFISRTTSPNVIEIYDIGVDVDYDFIVLEYLHGKPLSNVLGDLNLIQILHYAHQIANGLSALHRNRIAHCALKAENIFLTATNQVKLVNFGHASHISVGTKSTAGNQAYRSAAEEQPAKDLCDFGALLNVMIEMDKSKKPASLQKKLLEVAHRCMSTEFKHVIDDSTKLVNVLELLLGDYPLHKRSRRPVKIAASLGGVGLVCVFLWGGYAYYKRARLFEPYEVIRGQSSLGCAMDQGAILGASAHMPTPESGVLRFHVRRSDDSVWEESGELTLYVGDGPTCADKVPNVPKVSASVIVGHRIQVIDLPTSQYDGKWSVGEVKKFWIGLRVEKIASYRASNQVSTIKRRD